MLLDKNCFNLPNYDKNKRNLTDIMHKFEKKLHIFVVVLCKFQKFWVWFLLKEDKGAHSSFLTASYVVSEDLVPIFIKLFLASRILVWNFFPKIFQNISENFDLGGGSSRWWWTWQSMHYWLFAMLLKKEKEKVRNTPHKTRWKLLSYKN